MSKKKKAAPKVKRKKKSASSKKPTLASLRRDIDKLDRQIVELINRRAETALEIGRIKDESGQVIYQPCREEQVLDRVVSLSKGPIRDDCVRAVFREVISGSRTAEQRLRVAYLGPEYTYSYLAAIHRFGHSVELVPVRSIAAVFEEVQNEQADYGVVPIENSTDGRIVDTLDSFTRFDVRVCGEVPLRIHHHLLGRCQRKDVKQVYSKPQAISQCRKWLTTHLPEAELVEVTSTAIAAEMARDQQGAAAIASRQAAVNYNLDFLAESIEDNAFNLTRFAVIGCDSPDKTGKDKTALMFQTEHKPGGLADAMMVFKRNRLNLTWIESFPIAGSQGTYLFFAELEGHQDDLRVRRALESLTGKSTKLTVLGSFAQSQPVE